MTWFGQRMRRDNRAVATLEFTIVAGMVCFVILAIIEASLLWWIKTDLVNTASSTARCGAQGYRFESTTCVDTASTQSYAVTMSNSSLFTGAVAASDVTVTSNVNMTSANSACGTVSGVSIAFFAVTVASRYFTFMPPPFNNITASATGCYPVSP